MNLTGPPLTTPRFAANASKTVRPPEPARTKEHIFLEWHAQIKQPSRLLEGALKDILAGRVPTMDVQRVFHQLICDEAYGVFVEVYEAYHEILQKEVESGVGEPSRRELWLSLPPTWSPEHVDQLEEALRRIRCERLVVNPHGYEKMSGAPMISAAVCRSVAAILSKGQTTEFHLHGIAECPEVIAEAFENSQLQDIHFFNGDGRSLLLYRQRYETLAMGLVNCASLKGFHIHDTDLVWLHNVVEQFAGSSQGPRLESMSVRGVNVDEAGVHTDLVRLMQAAAKIPTLTSVQVRLTARHIGFLETALLQPLAGHGLLEKLEIHVAKITVHDAQSMKVLAHLARFLASCPSLTHFAWKTIAPIKNAATVMNALKLLLGSLDLPEESAAVAQAFATGRIRLRSLTMQGLPLPSGPLRAFVVGVLGNSSLRYLDLSGCCADLEAAVSLIPKLKMDRRFEAVFPIDYAAYYLVSGDGLVHGFLSREIGKGFVFAYAVHLDEAARTHARAAFNRLPVSPDTLFVALRRNLLHSSALPPVEANVEAFMRAALAAVPENASRSNAERFSLPASLIVDMLVDEQRLPTGVHLTRLNKNMHAQHEASEQSLIHLDELVKQEKTRNAEIINAVDRGDVEEIRRMLQSGAVDTGGHGLKLARRLVEKGWIRPAVLEVFKEQMPSLRRAMQATTINTTTKTSTTSTAGTSRTMDAVNATVNTAALAEPDSMELDTPIGHEEPANSALMALVYEGNVDGLNEMLRAGARDPRGQALTLARALVEQGEILPDVLDAFRRHAPQ